MNLNQSYCIGTRCELKRSCRRYLPASADVTTWRIDPAFDGVECPNYEESDDPYYDALDKGLCPKCLIKLSHVGGCAQCMDCGFSVCG